MPLKTYETIGILNRHTIAIVDGNEIPIHFANGTESPRRQQGRYATTNKKIQEYLERSAAFNLRWKLVSVAPAAGDTIIPKDEDPYDDLAKVADREAHTPPANCDDLGTSPGSVVEETDEDITPEVVFEEPEVTEPPTFTEQVIVGEEVINGQQARNYLIEHFKDLTFRQVSNNTQIISEAKARKVQFTHWEAFVTAK